MVPIWVDVVPEPTARIGLSESAYATLALLQHYGAITTQHFARWVEATIGAVRPGWLCRALQLESPAAYFDVDPQRWAPAIPFAKRAFRVCASGTEFLPKSLTPEQSPDRLGADLASAASAISAAGSADKYRAWLKTVFPTPEKLLACRERVTVDLAVDFYVRASAVASLPPLRVALLALVGTGGQCAARVLTIAAISPTAAKLFAWACRHDLFARGLDFSAAVLKGLHLAFHRSGIAPCPMLGTTAADDVDHLRNWHLLVGRHAWPESGARVAATLRDRLEPLLDQVGPEPGGRLSAAGLERFCQAHGARLASLAARSVARLGHVSLDEYVGQRLNSLAADGSARELRKTAVDLGGDGSGLLARPTKRLFLAAHGASAMRAGLASPPGALGTCIVKAEPGRERALLASDTQHWAVEALALSSCEDAFYATSPYLALGKSGFEDAWRAVARRHTGASMSLDLDFDDFNHLHTLPRMQAVYRQCAAACRAAIPAGAGPNSAAASITAAFTWSADAMDNLVLARGALIDGRPQRLQQGLWSGWRSTQLFNCLFNCAYVQAILTHAQECFGEEVLVAEGQGDDGRMAVRSEWWALHASATPNQLGLAAQASKQLVDSQQDEFLRLVARPSGTKGSLVRSVANAASHDLQGPEVHAGPESAAAIASLLRLWLRRGADAAALGAIAPTFTGYWARVRPPPPAGSPPGAKVAHVPIPAAVLAAPAALGGFEADFRHWADRAWLARHPLLADRLLPAFAADPAAFPVPPMAAFHRPQAASRAPYGRALAAVLPLEGVEACIRDAASRLAACPGGPAYAALLSGPAATRRRIGAALAPAMRHALAAAAGASSLPAQLAAAEAELEAAAWLTAVRDWRRRCAKVPGAPGAARAHATGPAGAAERGATAMAAAAAAAVDAEAAAAHAASAAISPAVVAAHDHAAVPAPSAATAHFTTAAMLCEPTLALRAGLARAVGPAADALLAVTKPGAGWLDSRHLAWASSALQAAGLPEHGFGLLSRVDPPAAKRARDHALAVVGHGHPYLASCILRGAVSDAPPLADSLPAHLQAPFRSAFWAAWRASRTPAVQGIRQYAHALTHTAAAVLRAVLAHPTWGLTAKV